MGSGSRIDRKVGPSLPPNNRPITSPDRISRKDGGHFEYPYRDRSFYYYDRHYYPSRPIFSWISWPDCCRPICYDYGPECTFGFFWPYYHRKFIFISLGGYWPCYTYRRYYWYGWHPYEWYGSCPPEYVKLGDTYNYYYYNAPPAKSPDANDLEQAGKKLEESPPAGPQERTQADGYFEEGVKAFEGGNYAAAAAKFGAAMELAPDDIVLPFAYAQAVFAQGEYEKSADVLREVLAKTSPEKEGVFYPRGLYPADDALQEQIKHLKEKVTQDPLDADLQLLLGYQLLGVGRLDEAAKPLANARLDYNNHQAATVLLNLLEKLKKADEGSRPTASQPRN
jgi:tetratricopeptide (TPR) repeat protein